jgi:hypothetical protein
MINNFITLTKTDEKLIHVNASLIESINRKKNYTLIIMGFGSENFHEVIETYEDIIKKIEETGTFKTIIK